MYRTYIHQNSIYSTRGYPLVGIDNIKYGKGVGRTPQELIANISEALDLAQSAIVKLPAPCGSAGINSTLYLYFHVTQYANHHLCAEDSDIAGAIVFHGTTP
ncbi:hypothetical protein GGR53DRAFT_465691 [Hypoxylon sp. FL1150]|nr:hypothetical protein GGR53DRAFT_465691 [Hypoxylon sp. FL1150]